MVQRLDRPVPAQQVGEPGGAGLGEAEAGNGIDGHGRAPPRVVVEIAGLAGDLQDLDGVREPEAADRDRLESPDLDAAMAAVTGAVQLGDTVPGQALAAVQQGRLVGLDLEQLVRVLLGHQELGGLGVGLVPIGVTTTSARSSPSRSGAKAGTSWGAPPT